MQLRKGLNFSNLNIEIKISCLKISKKKSVETTRKYYSIHVPFIRNVNGHKLGFYSDLKVRTTLYSVANSTT